MYLKNICVKKIDFICVLIHTKKHMNPSLKTVARWSFWIGAALVIATHLYMLTIGLPASQMMGHAVLNLIAAALMVFGWMKR